MAPSSSSAENSLSVETTIYLFLKYYPVENRLEQIYFFKKGAMYELSGLFELSGIFLNPVQQKIHRHWVDNVEVIPLKKSLTLKMKIFF